MKILVTGFEPFGSLPLNSSWETVKRLPDNIGGCEIVKIELPVVFGEAADIAFSYATEIKADAVLLVGQAEGYKAVAVERVGLNLRDARIPDNRGNRPSDEPVREGGENALFVTLPVKDIVEAIKDKGIACVISYSAGTYVCNDILYSLLHDFGEEKNIGFIHLPELNNKNGISDLDMVTAITVAIETISHKKEI